MFCSVMKWNIMYYKIKLSNKYDLFIFSSEVSLYKQ